MNLDELRTQIAEAKGIPALADRLTGTTREEITADADTLRDILGKPRSGTIDRPAGDTMGPLHKRSEDVNTIVNNILGTA